MKRILTAFLILSAMTLFAGCQRESAEPDPAETPAPTGGASPLLSFITPEPGAAPNEGARADIALDQYQYETLVNDPLGLAFAYPSHWAPLSEGDEPNLVFAFRQPAEPGKLAAFMSVAAKPMEKVIVTEDVVRDRLLRFVKNLAESESYGNFQMERGARVAVNRRTWFYCLYTCEISGVPATGYAALTYSGNRKNTLYLFHFYCATDDFLPLDPLRGAILKSIRF